MSKDLIKIKTKDGYIEISTKAIRMGDPLTNQLVNDGLFNIVNIWKKGKDLPIDYMDAGRMLAYASDLEEEESVQQMQEIMKKRIKFYNKNKKTASDGMKIKRYGINKVYSFKELFGMK